MWFLHANPTCQLMLLWRATSHSPLRFISIYSFWAGMLHFLYAKSVSLLFLFFIFIFICMLTCRNTYMLLNWELIKFGDGKKYVCSFVKLSRYMDFLMYIAIPFLITVVPYIFGKNYENIIHVMNWFLPLWDWHFLFLFFFLHHIYFFLKLCWNVNFSCIISDWVIFILKTNFIKTKIYILSKIVLNGILILLHYRVGMYLNNNILKCVL